jgi:hypothetical protein
VPHKTVEYLAGLRAGARPRDLLGLVQLLLLALGLLIDACVFVMVVLSVSQPPVLWVLGMAAAPALAIAWLGAYRKRSMGPIADGVTIGSLCVITMRRRPPERGARRRDAGQRGVGGRQSAARRGATRANAA